jgi:ribosomal protein S12 methylthiotransferase accessory factor
MEAIELHHAEHITRPLVHACYADLQRSHQVVDVRLLPRCRRSGFRPRRNLLWVEGFDLIGEEPVWVPYELVHTDYRFPMPLGTGCFQSSSNGLASGNHVLEAISHGICEVVERDATTLWFQLVEESIVTTRIDLDSVDDVLCRAILQRYADAGVGVAVWETTTDLAIPAFLCRIAELESGPLRSVSSGDGMGCHPDRRVALLRALTEAAQSRLTWISGARDDPRPEDYDGSPEALRRTLESMVVRGPMRRFCEGPSFVGQTFEADIAWQLDRLQTAGITRVICVDLTKPECGIPVVRVIIPGLEGIGDWAGFADYLPGSRARRRAWRAA